VPSLARVGLPGLTPFGGHQSKNLTLWVPETRLTPADQLHSQPAAARHDPPMALCLIYVMLTKLLAWIVLLARADTIKEIEILALRHQLAVLPTHAASTDALGPTEP
jgi:hypothetical protein